MSGLLALRLLAVAALAALATELACRLAPRLGWVDAARGQEAVRKLQRRAVPAVGGAALLVALAAAPASSLQAGSLAWAGSLYAGLDPAAGLTLAALFALGTLDDRLGLGAGTKLLGQLAALLPLAIETTLPADGGSPGGAGWLRGLGWLLLGGIALNALNTFDNADGALASLCALGLPWASPFACAACLGFLPLNLDRARPRNRESGAPSAYLGDAGAFVLGFWVLVTPGAWGVLWLPALDLARLAVVRTRAGSRPWIGDRRHLAHRLQARGLPPLRVALLQAGVALPAAWAVALRSPGEVVLPALGLAAGLLGYLLLLGWSGRRPA